MHSMMFANTYVWESTFSAMNQVKSKNRNRMADETLDDSLRLATPNTSIDKGRIVSRKSQPQEFHCIEICNNLLLCNNFNDPLAYLPFFKSCASVVSYIILLKVVRTLSRFCKMACRSKVVGSRWHEQCKFLSWSRTSSR